MNWIDCNDGPFTLELLELSLRLLNETGGIEILNVRPGSVSILELGAQLSRAAEKRTDGE